MATRSRRVPPKDTNSQLPKPSMSQPAPDKASMLPKSLVAALPSALNVLELARGIERELGHLGKDLDKARKGGAVQMARAFVVLHRLMTRIDETLKPLTHEDTGLFAVYKRQVIPELFEAEGVKNIPLAEGFRVGVGSSTRASIKKDMKDRAYQWLRENGLGDLITSTVNSSTLSAAARELLDVKNKEMPDELFNVALMPTTSVTKT